MSRRIGLPSLLLLATIAVSHPRLHAARQDGLVVYLTFDDRGTPDRTPNPLYNFAPNSDVVPEQKGDALEMTFTEGRFGKAAVFTNNPSAGRINDWAINLGKLDAVYAGSFTIACWVKYGSSHNGVILGNKEFSNNFSPGFLLLATAAKHFHAAGPSGIVAEGKGVPMADNKWHHWAAVFNRATSTITFYEDGNSVLTTPLADAKLDNGGNTVVGAGADDKNGAKQLAVDDLGIWNRALQEKEIAALGTGQGRRIPEPATYALAGGAAGLVAAFAARRRKRATRA